VGKFPFMASGKALAVGESEGFVKLLVGEKHGEILGAHIIGADATEMIAELGLAINMEATYEEITATIHAHPTLSEAIHEAAHASQGHAIHF
jgi:dihydrolipoamide dehydrogenase